ncbi:MAG TPA: PEP-CTERM sorting domain-containing protein [Caulobacteraceae bacterium]|jgi:hypothetical protein|nr:PEP-CTERM sorting domain-containing protein [Caulobacteraceae bacterium]
MKISILAPVVGATMIAGLASAGAASAVTTETFNLTVDGCSSTCFASGVTSLGTVTVTQTGGALDFAVDLTGGTLVNANGNSQHHALAFSIAGSGVSGVSISDLSTGFGSSVSSTPAVNDAPFTSTTKFDDAINYTGSAHQGSTPSSFSFVVTDSANNLTLSDLTASTTSSFGAIYIAADVFANGQTGNVGALAPTTSIATPEPGSWALMLIGVGLVGAPLRARRRNALALATARI